jgi:MarR family transcriptional regulator, 2-MHQ and catechol-resistance regulon repressor
MTRTKTLDDPLVTTFGRLLEATHHLEDLLRRDLAASSDLPLTWFEVLLRLSRSEGGELTMGELSEQLALTTGGVTRLIDRMSAVGYVERRPCETDRRVLFTTITPTGRAVLAPALRGHVVALRELFSGFSATDLARFDTLLDRLRDAS